MRILHFSILTTAIALTMSLKITSQVQVIPMPQKIEKLSGNFLMKPSIQILFTDTSLNFAANYLAQNLSPSSSLLPKTTQKPGKYSRIELSLLSHSNNIFHREGYELLITPQKISITALTPAGIFYGIQTLIQLLPTDLKCRHTNSDWNYPVPCLRIIDYPRFEWRGLMLDVSRHFFTKHDVKKYIDQMVKYKFNTLHLHLTDDHGWRIEIKSLPRLTEVGAWRVERYGEFGTRKKTEPGEKATYGGYYTHDDIKELVNYAAKRHVTIVPEIDVPGHCMAAIASYPYLSCTSDTSIKVDPGTAFAQWHNDGTFTMFVDNTLNPANEEVYIFLEKVFTEIASLFPSEYIHVGGDECYKGFWAQNAACQELMRRNNFTQINQLQGYFMQRVQQIIHKLGKKMIGWDEIYEDSLPNPPTLMCWRDVSIGFEAAAKGFQVVMAPTAYSYLDYYQGDPLTEPPVYAGLRLSKVYQFNPCPYPEISKNILGGQGNLWTENIPNLQYAFYMTYPRALAIAENYWTLPEYKNWDSFIQRVIKHFYLFDCNGIAYSRAIYDPIVTTYYLNNQLMLKLQCEAPEVTIHYTLDGTIPTPYSPVYSEPVAIPEGRITLRVRTYQNKQPMGNLLAIPIEKLASPPYLSK